MSEKENVELVQSFYATSVTGDINALLALLSSDIEVNYSGPSIIPAAGTWRGHEGFLAHANAAMAGHIPPESYELQEFIAQGDRVVVAGHSNLRVKPTGKTCETDFLHFFTIRDGKIARFRDFFDTFALAQAYLP